MAQPSKSTDDATDENAPLLAPTTRRISSTVRQTQEEHGDVPTPSSQASKGFDTIQILFLCYSGIAEPIAFFSIFPYVNEMIHQTGSVPETSVGFYSGLIESLFSATQMILVIFYGRMADRVGRKPVLVFSQIGVAMSMALFGLSRTVWQMILFRCLGGSFAGSVVTIRTMLSENCDREGQAKAFSWYAFARNLGIFIGPLIGGTLARPADIYPNFPSFFKDYPYALPGFAACGICISAAFVSLFVLKETIASKQHKDSPEKMSTWQVLRSPGVATVLAIYGQVYLQGLAFTAMAPLSWFTSITNGGFSFSEGYIAGALSICGVCQSLFMLFVFPVLQPRFGNGNVLKFAAYLDLVFFLSFPIFNQFLKLGWRLAFWISASIVWSLCTGGAMAFTSTQMCINNICPSSEVLATTNALAVTVSSGVRAFTPALFTSLYAIGVENGIAGGNLAWYVLAVMGAGLLVGLRYLPDAADERPSDTE